MLAAAEAIANQPLETTPSKVNTPEQIIDNSDYDYVTKTSLKGLLHGNPRYVGGDFLIRLGQEDVLPDALYEIIKVRVQHDAGKSLVIIIDHEMVVDEYGLGESF